MRKWGSRTGGPDSAPGIFPWLGAGGPSLPLEMREGLGSHGAGLGESSAPPAWHRCIRWQEESQFGQLESWGSVPSGSPGVCIALAQPITAMPAWPDPPRQTCPFCFHLRYLEGSVELCQRCHGNRSRPLEHYGEMRRLGGRNSPVRLSCGERD